MARFNLRYAARVLELLGESAPDAYAALARRVGLGEHEAPAWVRAAESMYLPYDEELGIHPQDADFLDLQSWDFSATPSDKYPLLLHFHPLVIYRHQVLKQADVVLAMSLRNDQFSPEVRKRNFDYYDPITTGDSSLSACVQAAAAAQIGYGDLAVRLLPRGDVRRPRRPPRQHPRRSPRGVGRRCVGDCRLRVRRDVRDRHGDELRPQASRALRADDVPRSAPRLAHAHRARPRRLHRQRDRRRSGADPHDAGMDRADPEPAGQEARPGCWRRRRHRRVPMATAPTGSCSSRPASRCASPCAKATRTRSEFGVSGGSERLGAPFAEAAGDAARSWRGGPSPAHGPVRRRRRGPRCWSICQWRRRTGTRICSWWIVRS